MSHLGAFATDKAGMAAAVPFDARVVGVWEGTTSKALGGYRQRIEFHNDPRQKGIVEVDQFPRQHVTMSIGMLGRMCILRRGCSVFQSHKDGGLQWLWF